MSITIATWNVNSLRARLPIVLDWLREAKPDIALFQELKCTAEQFPYMEIEELGYNIALQGEKSWNGVAILSKFPLDDVTKCLGGDDCDTQARYIEAVANLPGKAIRVASVYVPNGQAVDSDKFPYKLKFLERLHTRIKELLPLEEMFVIGGDYNVAPFAVDVYDPARLDGSVCYHPEERARLRKILNLGVYDAYRLKHADHGFSWWDYRANSLAADHGLRIDHLLVSPQAADKVSACEVHREWRLKDKASDHAAVSLTLS